MNGEYHTHTGQSKDATSSFMSLNNVLAAAFRNEDVLQNDVNSAAQFDNIQHGDAFDFLGLADHLRQSYNGVTVRETANTIPPSMWLYRPKP